MSLHDWGYYDEELKIIKDEIKNKKTIYPFTHMSLIDDPGQQKNITELYLENNRFIPSKQIIKLTNNKIIIGYFSAEFHNHAVMHLMLDVFKIITSQSLKFMDLVLVQQKMSGLKK